MATHSSFLAWRGQGSRVGCRLWGRTESDTTEVTQQQQQGRVRFANLTTRILYLCSNFLFSPLELSSFFSSKTFFPLRTNTYIALTTLMPGKMEGKRRVGWRRMRWLDSITNSMDMNLSKGRQWRMEEPGMLQSTGLQRVGHDWD